MKNNFKVNILGKTTVGKHEFLGIEGGFGEHTKCVLVKDIARIHKQPLGEINRRINDNIARFKNYIDIIDLKGAMGINHSEIDYTQNGWNASKNVYILSERGYSKLLKILEDDMAWEIYDEFVDNYFNMRKELKISNKEKLLLNIIHSNTDIERAVAINLYEKEYVKPLEENLQKTTQKLEHKQEVINGISDELKLKTQRQLLNEIIKMKGVEKIQERWSILYNHYESKKHMKLSARLEGYNAVNTPKIKSKLQYIDEKLNDISTLYQIAVKLFESDFKDKLQRYVDAL